MTASFATSWLILMIATVVGAVTMAFLYVREARGERRPSKLASYRRRILPLVGLASIAALRAFVFKG